MSPSNATLTVPPGRAARRRQRRGNMALVTAVSFVALCGLAALVVDLGYSRMVRAQLQASTDAAALGAANLLDGTDAGISAAHVGAQTLAGLNKANGTTVQISSNVTNDVGGDVIIGFYDVADGSFTRTHDAETSNAVRVQAARSDMSPLFAGIAFQKDSLGAGACTLAVQQEPVGALKVPWYLPFALPGCIFDQYTETQLQTQAFKLQPAGIDNTGWARVGASANASWAKAHITDIQPCMSAWAETGHVETPCAEAEVGDLLYLNNGAVQSALADLNSELVDGVAWRTSLWDTMPTRQSTSTVNTSVYGTVYTGPVPIFEGDSSYCSASASWNGTETISGFAWGVIYDMKSTGAASSRTIWMRVDPNDYYNVGKAWGAPDYGVTVLPPAKAVACTE
jgi:Flp pilus assembly protein TadG